MKHGNHDGVGIDRKLHNPIEDRLIPLESLDLSSVRSVGDLVRAMGKTAFTGRQVGEAADVLEAMARDTDCFVVMTLAGAMTVAKQSLIIADLIDRGIVNAIVSTGALMAHGLVEATGCKHYRYDPRMDDVQLYEAGYNRVYDTLEPETNLDHVELVMEDVLGNWDANETMCSWRLNQEIGKYLKKKTKGRGILKSAFEKGVPVFVPAFTDSEMGLDVALNNRMRARDGQPPLNFNPFLDLNHFAETLLKQKRLGKGATRTGANVRAAWAFTLWGDPTLRLPSPPRPDDALTGVQHEVQGNTIIVSLPSKVHEKVESNKFQVQMPPNARLAGLIRKDGNDSEKPLVPFVFVEVSLPKAPAGQIPELHTKLPASHFVFCWDERRRTGYLLVTPRPRDEKELRFHVSWNKPVVNADTDVGN